MPTLLRIFLLFLGSGALPLQSQVVPVQANVDAQAQRRIQADAQESLRRRRVEENIRRLLPALDPANLTGPKGPAKTVQAMAAFADLLNEGITPKESVQQALKKSVLEPSATEKTSVYLLKCWSSLSDRLTPEDLPAMRKGEEPTPPLNLPPYQP
ncbi:MAG: hypothetical protein EB056_04425 [Verrucomicrobia bacterium]|nr:hypothetical protein [Verrucomicrobiota bacterium]